MACEVHEVQEVRVQELLGRRVLAGNGRPIGRIEEIHAEPHGRVLAVEEVLVGPDAALERLAASRGRCGWWSAGSSSARAIG